MEWKLVYSSMCAYVNNDLLGMEKRPTIPNKQKVQKSNQRKQKTTTTKDKNTSVNQELRIA